MESSIHSAAIYELSLFADNPLFDGLASTGIPSVLGRKGLNTATNEDNVQNDFCPEIPYNWNWKLTPLKSVWKEVELEGYVFPFNDFPCMNLSIPVFSERAVDILRPFLEENGELLPVTNSGRRYYVYNCLAIVEIVDQEKTTGSFFHERTPGNPSLAISISNFSIRPNDTRHLSIFRFRELPNWVFVTNRFTEVVQANALNGFRFKKAWPLPPGSDYFSLHARGIDLEVEQVATSKGLLPPKSESLIIEFPLSAERIRDDEKKLLNKIQKDLKCFLEIRQIETDYFGILEKRKTQKGKTSFIFSCPAADLLLRKLQPFLETVDWPKPPRVSLRDVSFEVPI